MENKTKESRQREATGSWEWDKRREKNSVNWGHHFRGSGLTGGATN